MSGVKSAREHLMGSMDGRRLSRRGWLRNVTAASVAALAGSHLLEACSPPPPPLSAAATVPPSVTPGATPMPLSPAAPTAVPTVPAPAMPSATPTAVPAKPAAAPTTAGSMSLLEALKKRKSATAFRPQELPRAKLLELLWAAWGINRTDSGKRTAPSAMNSQEIDIYVLLSDGVYVYDPKTNQLASISGQDLRTKAASSGALRDAAVQLLFVADYARFRAISQVQKELYSAAHAGFIGQNVYLYCAAEGLGARFYAGIDRAGLRDNLMLRSEQAIVFAQAVGYARE